MIKREKYRIVLFVAERSTRRDRVSGPIAKNGSQDKIEFFICQYLQSSGHSYSCRNI